MDAGSGGCAMFKRCAARLKLISSATATNCSNWRRFGIRYLRGILVIWTPYWTEIAAYAHCLAESAFPVATRASIWQLLMTREEHARITRNPQARCMFRGG